MGRKKGDQVCWSKGLFITMATIINSIQDNLQKDTSAKKKKNKIQNPQPGLENIQNQNEVSIQIKEKEQLTAWRMEFPAEEKGMN